jgi:TatD DNase family protein
MQLIDTHCHIYTKEFDADRQPMIERSKTTGVSRMLMPAIDSSEHESLLMVEHQNPGSCLAMMGLHPCSVKDNYEDELRVVQQYFEKRNFIAVGETGLDFYWDLSFKDQQYDAFHRQAEWALEYDIPLVIHSRESTDECIGVVQEHQKGQLKGVFHCFSGSVEQARKIIDLGFHLGIGGVVTFKNGGLDKVMSEMDLSHVVLETDAPYLTPVPFRGKRNECSYISYVAAKLAEIKALDVTDIASITTKNAQSLFRL